MTGLLPELPSTGQQANRWTLQLFGETQRGITNNQLQKPSCGSRRTNESSWITDILTCDQAFIIFFPCPDRRLLTFLPFYFLFQFNEHFRQ